MLATYDKEGQSITNQRYMELSYDENYKRIAITETVWGTVSTVWLGLNHGREGETPLIFESMLFINEDWLYELERLNGTSRRYSAEEEAVVGHDYLVKILCTEGAREAGLVKS